MRMPCLKCGDLSPESYCEDHKPANTNFKSEANKARQKVIYNWSWVQLSEKARKLQPWCTDCGHRGSRDNLLSADHLPVAHWKMEQGLALDLTDVEVVCMRCNEKRGPAMVGSKRYTEWLDTEHVPPEVTTYSSPGGVRVPYKGHSPVRVGDSPVTLSPDSDTEPNKYSILDDMGNQR